MHSLSCKCPLDAELESPSRPSCTGEGHVHPKQHSPLASGHRPWGYVWILNHCPERELENLKHLYTSKRRGGGGEM